MAIFKTKAVAPTATDLRDNGAPAAPDSSIDAEKVVSDNLEESGGGQHKMDPELEKRVVRKLDWRVPPLVSGLCKCVLDQTGTKTS